MAREFLPPLLRGLGTLLILLVSAVVVVAEDRAARRLDAWLADTTTLSRPAGTAVQGEQLAALVREVRMLRRQGRHDLSDRVLGNAWFQALGLLGSALIAGSFLLEAWQKRHGRLPARAPDPEAV